MNSKPPENAASRSSERMDSLDSSMISASKKEVKEMKNPPRLPQIQVQLQPEGEKTLVADGTAGAVGGMGMGDALKSETGSALSSSAFIDQQQGLSSSPYRMKNGIAPAPQSTVNSSAGSKRKEPSAVNSALQSTSSRSPQPPQQQQHSLSALTQVNGGARIGDRSPKNQAKNNELSPLLLKDVTQNSSRVITSQSLLRALNLTPSPSSPRASDVYPREASTDQLKREKRCEVLLR